jgi:hypothetical protein
MSVSNINLKIKPTATGVSSIGTINTDLKNLLPLRFWCSTIARKIPSGI